jgi:hypothetical protein
VLRHEPSIDFQSAVAARLDGIPDPEVLRLAMVQGRILISHDENSMPGHFADFLNGGNRSPGVLIVPQGAPSVASSKAFCSSGSRRKRRSGLIESRGCLFKFWLSALRSPSGRFQVFAQLLVFPAQALHLSFGLLHTIAQNLFFLL